MHAITLSAPRQTAVTTLDLPGPGAGEVELRVLACGICGSNLHAWAHPELAIQREGGARPGAAGHEIAGEVLRVGAGVTRLEAGQQVCIEPNLATGCGVCAACIDGRAWFCRDQTDLACWGFADTMIVPARAALPAPGPVPAEVLTLAEPLACAVHALRHSWTATARGFTGRHVVVVGAGVAGLLAIPVARDLGAARVTVLARHPHQAAAGLALGADRVLRDADESEVRALRADLVLEAVGGRTDTLATSFAAAARGAEIVVLGLFDEPQSFDARKAVFRELRMFFPVTYGMLDGVSDFAVALEMVVRRQDMLAALVTHRLPLERADEAFALAADKRRGALRVVVAP